MHILALTLIILSLLAISTEAVRRFLIYKAKRHERRRKRKEIIIDSARNSAK